MKYAKSLYDMVLEPYLYRQRKHDLGEHYAEDYINTMSNIELLDLISATLEEMKLVEERRKEEEEAGRDRQINQDLGMDIGEL